MKLTTTVLLTSILLFLLSYCNVDKDKNTIQITPRQIQVNSSTDTVMIDIKCNTTWTINYTATWCKLSALQGQGDGEISIIISENKELAERITKIYFITDDDSEELEIIQKGKEDRINYAIPPDKTGMRELTALEISNEMLLGWNIGNSLEAVGGETAWGNPLITKQLIDSVKAAGFNVVRIPVAWSKFSDLDSFKIKGSFFIRVEEAVNYVLDNNMYAIINIHWDGGWMQPTYADQEYVTNRLEIMWKQIATYFRNYDDRLLFAGTNEVMKKDDWNTPTKEYYTVQNGFNQTFVTTVRLTGGKNVYRHLIVQGFNTNINYTVNYATMPVDSAENKLFMEVHYYDPFNFTLNENSELTQWGNIATDPLKTETSANESYADAQFNKMKTNFIDKGIPVIMGEYGVIARTQIPDHEKYRVYYNGYITSSMIDHGIIPVYWDNGSTINYGMGLFNRNDGSQVYPDIIKAISAAIK